MTAPKAFLRLPSDCVVKDVEGGREGGCEVREGVMEGDSELHVGEGGRETWWWGEEEGGREGGNNGGRHDTVSEVGEGGRETWCVCVGGGGGGEGTHCE